MKSLTIDAKKELAPTRDFPPGKTLPEHLPLPKEVNVHPSKAGGENASLFFVGTATTILYAQATLDSNMQGTRLINSQGMGRTPLDDRCTSHSIKDPDNTMS
jgi:hypothetical protein